MVIRLGGSEKDALNIHLSIWSGNTCLVLCEFRLNDLIDSGSIDVAHIANPCNHVIYANGCYSSPLFPPLFSKGQMIEGALA